MGIFRMVSRPPRFAAPGRTQGQYTDIDQSAVLDIRRVWVNTRPAGNKPATRCAKVVSTRRTLTCFFPASMPYVDW